jgi:hypothetical protein
MKRLAFGTNLQDAALSEVEMKLEGPIKRGRGRPRKYPPSAVEKLTSPTIKKAKVEKLVDDRQIKGKLLEELKPKKRLSADSLDIRGVCEIITACGKAKVKSFRFDEILYIEFDAIAHEAPKITDDKASLRTSPQISLESPAQKVFSPSEHDEFSQQLIEDPEGFEQEAVDAHLGKADYERRAEHFRS